MRVHRIIDKTYAEGPGCRLCIWVQGCNHSCDGCFATELWDYNGGYDISVQDVIDMIASASDDIEGITLLGGEPFDKAEELAVIARYAKSIGKTVIAFTGYLYEQLTDEPQKALLDSVDLLLDGRFEKDRLDYSRPLVGSSNQRFIYLTDAISKSKMQEYKNRFEIRADINGKIIFNGMGDVEKLKRLLS